jgi:general secretion pathway protein I
MNRYASANQGPVNDAGGFTLLEVLIAFVIAILALSTIIAASAGALQASRTAARYQDATVRAQSRLAEATAGKTLAPGEREGDDGGGYHWRVRVTPLVGAPTPPAQPPATPLTLYAVNVWITWQDGPGTRDVHLQTEQIGQPAQTP